MRHVLLRTVAALAAFWLVVGGAYASLGLVGVPANMTLECDELVPPAPMVLATGGCPAVVTAGLYGVTGLFLTETNANGIALMPDGRLVVAHDDHYIRYYNATGGLIEAVGGFGTATGRYNRPSQLAVDAQGRLHVADRDNHRVQTYRADGSYEGTFGSFGTATGQFNLIDGIAYGPAYTNLVIADRSNHRVQFYNLNENMVFWTLGGFGSGPGQFNAPGAVIEDIQRRILVAELGGNRIQIFNQFLQYQGLLAGPGTAVTNLNFPRALATDTNGLIYAADTGNHRVLAWRPDGSLEGIFTGVGTSAGLLNNPQGLAVGLHGRLYVLEAGGRVLELQRGVAEASPSKPSVFTNEIPVVMTESRTGDCPAVITRIWTAVDGCGSTVVATQVITLVNNVPLELQGVPGNVTVDCDRVPPRAVVTAGGGCVGGAVPEDVPILHYRFDDPDDLARDSGAWSQHGTPINVSFVAEGVAGGAASFAGTGYVAITNLLGVDGASALTWSAWVNLTPGRSGLFGIMGATMALDESMYLVHDARGGTTRAYVVPSSRDAERYAEATNVVTAGVWQHVVGTYDGNTIRLYVDGALKAENTFASTQAIRSNNVPFAIGDAAVGRGWNLFGTVDELRMYARALSAAEVQDLHQSELAAVPVLFTETRSGECPGVITRVWTATDACGSSVAATQTINVLASDRDSDNDGLTDAEERRIGTNPNRADTDGDGRTDGEEVRYGTNPLVADVFPAFVRNDFDGDHRSDVGVYHPSSGIWYLQTSRDGYRDQQFGFGGTTPVPGDYDGDGKADPAIYDPVGGMWYIHGSRDGVRVVQWGFRGVTPVPADFDGDGRTDLGLFHARLGLYLVQGSSGGRFFQRMGLRGGQPVVGDFDGDGTVDFAVFVPAKAQWRIITRTGAKREFAFGPVGGRGFAGDFDGDGKADPAVYDATRGSWSVLGSASTPITLTVADAAGGYPISGDYNGDNRADYAAYLPLTGEWMIRVSPGLWRRVGFGDAASTPLGAGP
jgi:hypothetical protein